MLRSKSALRLHPFLASAVALGILYGCGGEEGEKSASSTPSEATSTSAGDGTEQPATPPLYPAAEPKESLSEAQRRIDDVLDNGNCDEIAELNPIILQEALDTEQRCEYLRQLADLEAQGLEQYSNAAGVIDYLRDGRTITALLVLDQDGRYHIAFIDPFRGVESAGTEFAQGFERAADATFEVLANKRCPAFIRLAYRRFGAGAGSKKQICEHVENNPVANIVEAFPEARLRRLGGNAGYAFYRLQTPGVFVTLVFAEQTEENAPLTAAPLPPGSRKYAYVAAYHTNVRPPEEPSS